MSCRNYEGVGRGAHLEDEVGYQTLVVRGSADHVMKFCHAALFRGLQPDHMRSYGLSLPLDCGRLWRAAFL